MQKNALLLVSWILSLSYLLYIIIYFIGIVGKGSDGQQFAAGLTILLFMPHAFILMLGILFNILGWAMDKRGFALTGAILYSVAMFLMIPTFYYLILQTTLSYIGFAQMKKPILINS